jgi:CDP-diacylglycerol--glycerol-3-phosphate 3-phosphatidyltransferase
VKLVPPGVERAYYAAQQPLVGWLLRSGIRPNTLTTIGAVVVLASAMAYGAGSIRLGGFLLLLSGLVDTLDGQVARHGGMVSQFGAFYDSTLDRVGDGATFIGIAAFLLTEPGVYAPVPAAIVCMVAVLASLIVSYARARAEGLGLDCRVGMAQRAERIIGIGLPSLLVGAGPRALVLEGIVTILAVLSVVTVVQRFHHVYRQTEGARAPGRTVPARAVDSVPKGS